jgi:hypothetical protein
MRFSCDSHVSACGFHVLLHNIVCRAIYRPLVVFPATVCQGRAVFVRMRAAFSYVLLPYYCTAFPVEWIARI